MSGEGSTENNISRQVTGSLVAGCQSDNDLQAVSQHVGEHMGPWAAIKRHVFFLEMKHSQHTKVPAYRVMGLLEAVLRFLSHGSTLNRGETRSYPSTGLPALSPGAPRIPLS